MKSGTSVTADHDHGLVAGGALAEEQQHLAASRAALRRMRERAQALLATGDGVAGDALGAESLGAALSRRVAELADDPEVPLFFGKLSNDDGEVHHIGRRHVTDDNGAPMVLDWRAPVSRAFYRAGATDPQGVAVRRRFGFAGGALTSFEDEHLSRGEALGTASRILTEEIERPRVGPMRDIVATIQPDQDELVRADLHTTICVQGAPGTGKTAVGLHRAAYLLYHHRDRLRRSGVLIVGPNRAFLRYISAVLPTLGEVDVRQSTIDELVHRVPVQAVDEPDTARIKHDARMAAVLHHALWGRVRAPADPLVVPDGSYRWRISAGALARIVEEVRREAPPYRTGRDRVRARVLALLRRQVEVRRTDSPSETWLRRVGRSAPVTGLLDAVWPAVEPAALVFGLLRDPAALAAAAEGILAPGEQELLRWQARGGQAPRSVRTARWSAADALLIDEAAGLIDRLPSFGHVVVDEAQDLSPMQARALARRSTHGSLTVLGDLAQGTAPWAATSWPETLAHLGAPAAPVTPLTTGFRVPGAVLALANRLLPALAVDVPAAVSLRHDGELAVRRVSDLTGATVDEVRAALAHEGSVAVIAGDAAVGPLQQALAGQGITSAALDPDAPGDSSHPERPGSPDGAAVRVSVVPASLAKGLEYDHVVVVEPADIVAAAPRGLHRLYVVLTRAVSRLTIVHARPMPGPLAGTLSGKADG